MRTASFLFVFFFAACSSTKQLSESSTKPNVVVFLALDCPISQKYVGRLNEIYLLYRDSVEWLGVIPQRVSQKQLNIFRGEYNVQFNLKIDKDWKLTKQLQATVTPEVFVLNNNNRIEYRGAVDNWFYDLGSYRQHTTENYLTDALKAILMGNVPRIKKTESVGCLITVPK
jgi:hypothetical protein